MANVDEQVIATADEYVRHEVRGDVVHVEAARRTLEDLIGGGSEGPARVRAALEAARERESAALRWSIGDRVECGRGADLDTGRIVSIRWDGTCTVAWDSGVTTPADLVSLREVRS